MTHKIAHQLGIKLSGDETSTEVEELIVKQLETVPYIQYPTAFHTVDIIATRNVESTVDGNLEVLLGRKHNATQWVFIGGFVEPTQTAEAAALRELHEETNVFVDNEHRLEYLGSLFIDDSRYKDSPHKITTSIFTVSLTRNEASQARVVYYNGTLGDDCFGDIMAENNNDIKARIKDQLSCMPARLINDVPASEAVINTRLEILAKNAPEKVNGFLTN